jgi:hypothetical protein
MVPVAAQCTAAAGAHHNIMNGEQMPIRFQVDGDFYDHPKTLGLSDAAVALWTRAGSYSTAKLLDGFVPEDMLAGLSRTPADASGELVRRGLWRRVRGGFRFHQWDERNLTKARVNADRDYDRARKQRERREARKNEEGQASPKNVRTGQPPDGGPDSDRNPNRSVSVSVSESVSGSGQPPAAVAEPPPQTCPKHRDDPDPPPCGACADARRARGRWDLADADRRRTAAKCRKHRGQPADTCGLCRADRLADPDA